MIKKITVLLALLLSSTLAFLWLRGEKSWDTCTYDKHCKISMDTNGNVKPVTSRVKALLSLLHLEIVEAGKKYGVDPRAIAGAIAAENSLNVKIDDSIQDFLANSGITNVMGRSFSYGIGQIYPETAIKVEAMAAEVENRPRRTKKQVADALTKPRESILYAAAILKDAQDKYKQAGISIQSDMGVLTTLYNLGEIDRRLANREKSEPVRPNFFGVFVQKNLRVIEDAIGWSPFRGKYDPAFGVEKVVSFDLNWFPRPQKIYRAPSGCKNNQLAGISGVSSVSNRYNKYPIGEVLGHFKVYRSTLDCELHRWSLVQSQLGQVGWIQNKTIKASAIKKRKRKPASLCHQEVARCLAQIEETSAFSFSTTNPIRLKSLSLRPDKSSEMELHYRWCSDTNQPEPVRVASLPSLQKGYATYQTNKNSKINDRYKVEIQKTFKDSRDWLRNEKTKLIGLENNLDSKLRKGLLANFEVQLDKIFLSSGDLRAGVLWEKKPFNFLHFKSLKNVFSKKSIKLETFIELAQTPLVSDVNNDFSNEKNKATEGSKEKFDRQKVVSKLAKYCKDFVEPSKFRILLDYAKTYEDNHLNSDFFVETQQGVLNLCLLSSKWETQRTSMEKEHPKVVRVSGDPSFPKVELTGLEFSESQVADFLLRQLIENNLNDQTHLGKVIGTRESSGGICNFDEKKSLLELHKVSRLPCVSRILVPQKSFFDRFSSLGPQQLDKVVFDNLPTDDFTVLVENCAANLDQIVPGKK